MSDAIIENAPNAQSGSNCSIDLEALKQIHARLLSAAPPNCELTVYYDVHYGTFKIGSDYVGNGKAEWRVSLRSAESESLLSPSGRGETPEKALQNAISDMFSRKERIDKVEHEEFLQWRSARRRKGVPPPVDDDEWDKAVDPSRADEDDEEFDPDD